MPEASRAMVVLGMHRTGTSLAMAALEALGVASGGHLLPPGPDNEAGYWEDKVILDLNERLLSALGKTWSSVGLVAQADWSRPGVADLQREAVATLRHHFAEPTPWGFKDPRSIRLLPFWDQVLRDVGARVQYVVTVRNPESVAASLAYRNQFACSKSYFLWLSHYLPVLDRLLQPDCLFVDYDRFVDNPRDALDRIAQFIDVAGASATDGRQQRVEAFLGETLRTSLRHTRFEPTELGADAPAILGEVFSLLDGLARGDDAAGAVRTVCGLQTRYREYASLLQQLDAREAEANALREVVRGEEPIRDKIEKMGLYHADIVRKMEQIDTRHATQFRQGEALAQGLAAVGGRMETLESRVEDVQEKVVVQMDELYRAIFGRPEHGDANLLPVELSARQLADARAELEALQRSTSWRITKPLRAVKLLVLKMLLMTRR